MEWLEERQLLTWVATFAQSTGTLTIQGVGLSSDTGVVKLDPNTGEILLDGNNSGNFVDTGANVSTINVPIQIEANTTLNSNFIIDNSSGGFFEASASYLAPAAYPAKTLFNYTGSTAFEPNSSLTIRGRAGVADTFTVNPDKTFQDTGVVTLTEPPNQLNQQLSLTVTYGYPPVAGAAANINATPGISGHLTLDGVDGAGGNDKLVVNDPTGVPSDWTLNGNEIAGPAFPTAPTVPPTPPTLPGTIGDITYANIANLQFNDAQAGDLLTINSVAANTAATTVGTTVVNYSQPLAFPINLIGGTQTTGGNGGGNTTSSILDIVGAPGGNNDFFVDDQSVSLAAAGTHPQYNTPFSHLGAGLTYTPGSLKELQVAGNGGDNTITVQVPPTLLPGFTSQTLPSTFVVYGGATPPPAQLIAVGVLPTPVTVGTDLLRVLGNAPGALTAGNDTITVSDFGGTTNTGGGGTTGANNIQMSRITAVVIYGEGGNDTLTNASTGIKAQGIPPVSGLLIGGSGNDTLVGGAGNDMLLGGDGQNTLTSSSVATLNSPTTTYFFPHQDPFGNIFDPFLNSANTTSTINAGTLGNQLVVTGVIANTGFKGVTGLPSDQDLGSLTSLTFPPGISGGLGTATVDLVPTVPPSNVTAPLYEATPALLALEQAIGEGSGPFPANEAALLEFGAKLDLRGPFASFAAFVGRAYDDFLVDRGGGGTFGGSNTGEGFAGGQGSAVVSNQEIQFWASQGLSVQQVQSQILGSDELRQTLPASDQWVRFLYQSVLGRDPTSAELTAYENVLNQGDTGAARYGLSLALLMSPAGQIAEIKDIYFNVVPGSPSPSSTDLAAVQADIVSGESLPQIAQTVSASQGNYLSYELAHNVGTVGFVAGVYQSVLHRAASNGDLAYWASVRGAGVSDAQIAQAILGSPEARAFLIQNAYESYLGRPADAGGMAYWQAVLSSGQITDEQFVASLIGSPEYYARNGSTSQSYVLALYHDLLARTTSPPQQEIDFWVSQLAMSSRGAAQARADIAVAFQQTSEYQTDLVNHWYQIYDGRAPSAGELNSALTLLQSGASDEYVQAQILAARQGS